MLTKDATKAYNAVVNSYAILTGIEYTVLLAAYALPVGFYLSRQADRIVHEIIVRDLQNDDKLTMREIRTRENLKITSQDILKIVIALLSPLITGSVATLSSVVN